MMYKNTCSQACRNIIISHATHNTRTAKNRLPLDNCCNFGVPLITPAIKEFKNDLKWNDSYGSYKKLNDKTELQLTTVNCFILAKLNFS